MRSIRSRVIRDVHAYSNLAGNALAPSSSALRLLTRRDLVLIGCIMVFVGLLSIVCTAWYMQLPFDNQIQSLSYTYFVPFPLSKTTLNVTELDAESCASDFTEASSYVQQVDEKLLHDERKDALQAWKQLKLPLCWSRENYTSWLSHTLPSRRQYSCHTCKSTVDLSIRDFVVNVFTGAIHHRDRADIIMCTWGQEFTPGQLWFHSDDLDTTEQRLPIFQAINEPGSWETSQKKWIPGLLHTIRKAREIEDRQHRIIKWFVVTDDDTMLFPNNLIRLASQYDPDQPIIVGSLNEKFRGALYGGAGWIYSSAAARLMEAVLLQCERFKHHLNPDFQASDVFIGVCLRELTNITFIDRHEFGTYMPDYYLDVGWQNHQTGFYRAVTYHYISDWHDHYLLYQLYKTFTFNIYE